MLSKFIISEIYEKKLITALLYFAVVSALLPSGFSWIDYEESISTVEGSLGFKVQWGGIFGLSLIIVLKNRYYLYRKIGTSAKFLILICMYCALSIIWSPLESATLKKTMQFMGLILLCMAIQADKRDWSYHVKVIIIALSSIEIFSVLAAIFVPSIGIDDYFGYAWRGVMAGKNGLGAVGALSIFLWVARGRNTDISHTFYWIGIGLSLLCVIMSRSSTAMLMAIMGPLAFFLLYKKHIGSSMWLARLLIFFGIFIILALHVYFIYEGRFPERADLLEPVAGVFGKTSDLTGRSDIWDPLIVEIHKHWFLGIGYGAFWLGPGSPSQEILDSLMWIPLQGHNGYLDLLNELGLVGCLLFSFWLTFYIRDLSRLVDVDRRAVALFGAMLATLLFSNLTESSMFRGVNFSFLMMIFSCISVTSALTQHVYSQRSGPRALSGRVLAPVR